MSIIRGTLRFTIIFITLFVVGLIIPLTAWIPIRYKRVRLSAWFVPWMVRFFFIVLNVRFHCDEADRYRQHEGFVFPNHGSYFDILMMMHIMPMRFLSNHKVRRWPVIGWIAIAIGTLFVDRGNKGSRHEARLSLANVERYPPIVLFPEGGIDRQGKLQPFRFGAFEIAAHGSAPYIPTAIFYDRADIIAWGDESIFTAVWRLTSRSGPIHAHLIPLPTVYPTPTDDPQTLAEAAQTAIGNMLAEKRRLLTEG
jgi:1-acyl-sn-glycerol-3-phosphate acyltransferase